MDCHPGSFYMEGEVGSDKTQRILQGEVLKRWLFLLLWEGRMWYIILYDFG